MSIYGIKNIALVLSMGCFTHALAAVTDSASNAYRDRGSNQLSLQEETTTYAGKALPANYREVPNRMVHDDGGRNSQVLKITASQHAAFKNCGYPSVMVNSGIDSSTIANRIQHCASVNPNLPTTWDGAANGISGEALWKLVSRADSRDGWEPTLEVWQDQRTGLLWSTASFYVMAWCAASGNNDSNDPGCSGNVQSACSETLAPNSSVAALPVLYGDDYNNGKYSNMKGQMGEKSSPSVHWRLPTRGDYVQALIDGMSAVRGDTDYYPDFWSATMTSKDRNNIWKVNLRTSSPGRMSSFTRNDFQLTSICVGR